MIYKITLAFLLISSAILICRTVTPEDEHHEADEHHDADDHESDDHAKSHDHYDKSGHHDDQFDHDAVAGSHHESEEFKDLEPEEAKRRLGILYAKIDTNADSNLTQTELYLWIIKSLRNLDTEDATHKLQEFDDNSDKKVSWDEFLSKTYGHNEKEINEMEKTKGDDMKSFLEGITMDKKKFKLADNNDDGFLDLQEFTKFTHPQNYKEMSSYELEKTLDDFDKNKDKRIDIKEFIADDKIDNETETHEKKNFKGFDHDHNGYLEGSEITDWVMPGFERTALSEVEHLFNETDANNDKRLTKEEVINQHELWVGSHATDYGKHLDDMKPHEEL